MLRLFFILTLGFILGAVVIEQKHYFTDQVALPVAFLPNGGQYEGGLIEGELNGLGRIVWPDGGVYQGGFRNGLFHGTGTLKQADWTYEGEFTNGTASGEGRIVFKDGRLYQGQVLNGKAHGLGLMTTPEGEYTGYFKYNQFDGEGRWIAESGDIYEGDFKEGEFHGAGIYTSANGSVYRGNFVAGAISGEGEYRDKSIHYAGSFKNWLFDGTGVLSDANGGYEGEFVAGHFHGDGVYTSNKGLTYKGAFRKGLYHGAGILEFNGERYQGEFEYGLSHGKGVLTYDKPVDGIERIEGVWRNGEVVSSDHPTLEHDARKVVEHVLYSQAQQTQLLIESVKEQRPHLKELYFVGIAGDGSQGVFRREVNYVRQLFDQHFGTEGRSAVLVNGNSSFKQAPLATLTSIERLLQGVAAKMDPENDILFVLFTSHGSPEFEFSLNQQGLQLQSLDAKTMARILHALPVRHKVIVISACYAGGYVQPVKDDSTMVVAASTADSPSFGCSDKREMTYFGEAFFKDALLQSESFTSAFDRAREIVRGMEAKAGFEYSNPLIFKPEAILAQLAAWRRELAEWQAIQSRTVED